MKECERVRALFAELTGAPRKPFPRQGDIPDDVPTAPGVYVIYDADGKVLYVGRTPRSERGIWRRLNAHLHGGSPLHSRMRIKLRNDCGFSYLVIENGRECALVEAYATGCLCPAYLGLGGKVVPLAPQTK